jgi:uncharacterized phage protein gp47/JayE
MNNPFAKSFDELLNDTLTDYQNQIDPTTGEPVDISKGSLAFIKGAVMASAAWGLYQAIAWTGDQIFPDTCSTDNLYHHGALVAVQPLPNESATDYLARVQLAERKPLAGGNQYDYVNWALQVIGVHRAWCYPVARGNGTVDVVITTDPASGTEIASADLCAQVKSYIDSLRPVGRGADAVAVVAPTIDAVNVTMSNLSGADPDVIAAEITSFLASFIPDQTLYVVQLKAIAISNGAVNPTVTLPAADVIPANHHMNRPGAINVGA